MIAVSMIDPFDECMSLARSDAATPSGNRTRASAVASRRVAVFAPTSTMRGRPRESRCESLRAISAADLVHLDALAIARGDVAAQFAVAIVASVPYGANDAREIRIARAGAHRSAQIVTRSREEAGIEAPVGRQARARAIAAERLRHRADEADFA